MDYIEKNKKHWNRFSKEGGPWSIPCSEDLIEKAKLGDLEVFITTTKIVPKSWFPDDLKGLKVLGLASGGGQQMPLLAAAGAIVTCLDISEEQLLRDQEVCKKYGLSIRTIQGNMLDLHMFKDSEFDFIINPVSTCFISNVNKVWNECYRVLKNKGTLITGSNNPVVYAISDEAYKNKELRLDRKIPYSDLETLSADELKNIGAAEFGHSLTDLIGGQVHAGFCITGFYEDYWGSDFDMMIDNVLPQFIATKAEKLNAE